MVVLDQMVSVNDPSQLMTVNVPVTTLAVRTFRDTYISRLEEGKIVPFRVVTCAVTLVSGVAAPLYFVYSDRPVRNSNVRVVGSTLLLPGGGAITIVGAPAHIDSMGEVVRKFLGAYPTMPGTFFSIVTYPAHANMKIVNDSYQFALALCLLGSKPVYASGKVDDPQGWMLDEYETKVNYTAGLGAVLYVITGQSPSELPGLHINPLGLLSRAGGPGEPLVMYCGAIVDAIVIQVMAALYDQVEGRAVASAKLGKTMTAINAYTKEDTEKSFNKFFEAGVDGVVAQLTKLPEQRAALEKGRQYIQSALRYWMDKPETVLRYFANSNYPAGSNDALGYNASFPKLLETAVAHLGKHGDGKKAANSVVGILQHWAASFAKPKQTPPAAKVATTKAGGLTQSFFGAVGNRPRMEEASSSSASAAPPAPSSYVYRAPTAPKTKFVTPSLTPYETFAEAD
jgi:hypothetical protein